MNKMNEIFLHTVEWYKKERKNLPISNSFSYFAQRKSFDHFLNIKIAQITFWQTIKVYKLNRI